MRRPIFLALLAVLSFAHYASCGSEADWLRVETQQCLSQSRALQSRRVSSKLMCVGFASTVTGSLVVQFDSDSLQCSLFQYASVCHLINGFASNVYRALHGCHAFVNAIAAGFMTLKRKLSETVGSKLRGAWIMSDDEEASKSSLFCDGSPRWSSNNVEWRSEGAYFNGVTSYMHMTSFPLSLEYQRLTILTKLKLSRIGNIFSIATCSDMNVYCALWSGYGIYAGPRIYRNAYSGRTVSILWRSNILNKSSSFVNLAAISPTMDTTTAEFIANSIVAPRSECSFIDIRSNPIVDPSTFCFMMGYNLSGFVRAVSIANDTLTETEVSKFFGLIP